MMMPTTRTELLGLGALRGARRQSQTCATRGSSRARLGRRHSLLNRLETAVRSVVSPPSTAHCPPSLMSRTLLLHDHLGKHDADVRDRICCEREARGREVRRKERAALVECERSSLARVCHCAVGRGRRVDKRLADAHKRLAVAKVARRRERNERLRHSLKPRGVRPQARNEQRTRLSQSHNVRTVVHPTRATAQAMEHVRGSLLAAQQRLGPSRA